MLTMKESDGGQEMIAGTDISLEYVRRKIEKAGKEARITFYGSSPCGSIRRFRQRSA